MSRESSQEKLKQIDELLNQDHVMVHLDPGRDGVLLPQHLMSTPVVTLKLSRLFRGTLKLTKKVIYAELLFEQRYFNCEIPFEAIWGVTTAEGENVIWPESTPKDILEKISAQPGDPPEEQPAPKKKRDGSHLRRVK